MNKDMATRTALSVLLFAAIVLLGSCSRKPIVVGIYQEMNGTGKITFTQDGIVAHDGGSAQWGGRYEVVDGNQVRLKIGKDFAVTFVFSESRDQVSVSETRGLSRVFKRLK
jgi:hypothetical protein